jgi:hypothetical protein
MKIPTLIVRLIGLYLVVRCTITLLQVNKMKALVGRMATAQDQIVGDIWIYAVAGLVVGIVATMFAGVLARLLTFDSGRE